MWSNGRQVADSSPVRTLDERERGLFYKIVVREGIRSYRMTIGLPPSYAEEERIGSRAKLLQGWMTRDPVSSCGIFSTVPPAERLDLFNVASFAAYFWQIEHHPADLAAFWKDVFQSNCVVWPQAAGPYAQSQFRNYMLLDPAYYGYEACEAATTDPFDPASLRDPDQEIARQASLDQQIKGGTGKGLVQGSGASGGSDPSVPPTAGAGTTTTGAGASGGAGTSSTEPAKGSWWDRTPTWAKVTGGVVVLVATGAIIVRASD